MILGENETPEKEKKDLKQGDSCFIIEGCKAANIKATTVKITLQGYCPLHSEKLKVLYHIETAMHLKSSELDKHIFSLSKTHTVKLKN